jgi:hypothetical protein
MIRLTRNSLLRTFITVFSAFALMAGFCFVDTDFLRAADLAAGGADGITGLVDNFIPPPAEEPALLSKTGNTRFIPLRTGFQRVFLPGGTYEAASGFYQPPLGAGLSVSCMDIKHTIFLNLRI